jgi:spermidine synthase
MKPPGHQDAILFILFLASGFCSLLYQIVWVRMAFAAFGVITPVLSVVLSVFMLGLAAGSWIGGRWIDAVSKKIRFSPILFYGLTELCIGIGGLVVPWVFKTGESLLLPAGEMDSMRYLLLSATILSISILPWCFCMGTTFPCMMAFIRRRDGGRPATSFSFLYLANVIGASGGTLLTAIVLIERMGFRNTSMVAVVLNALIAATAFAIGVRGKNAASAGLKETPLKRPVAPAFDPPINTLGCIIGPLLAGYVLLPFIGVRLALVALATPLALLFAVMLRRSGMAMGHRILAGGVLILTTAVALFRVTSYEDGTGDPSRVVRRDHVATVISEGTGMGKRLLVNGIHMTSLTSDTKIMAHLPLAILQNKPASALAICLGMGTTFRSLTTWDIDATVVELVPSVRDAFGYYFDDAAEILSKTRSQIVVDDGRRFLKRSFVLYDLITIDPPPPLEAAGSSLLYSDEFYECVKKRLKAGGIMQQWSPTGENLILGAVARSIRNSFPHVRVFRSVENWGFHFLASLEPISIPSADEFVRRLPRSAASDLMEWNSGGNIGEYVQAILAHEMPLSELLDETGTYSITDDRPFNEYYLIRRNAWRISGRL